MTATTTTDTAAEPTTTVSYRFTARVRRDVQVPNHLLSNPLFVVDGEPTDALLAYLHKAPEGGSPEVIDRDNAIEHDAVLPEPDAAPETVAVAFHFNVRAHATLDVPATMLADPHYVDGDGEITGAFARYLMDNVAKAYDVECSTDEPCDEPEVEGDLG